MLYQDWEYHPSKLPQDLTQKINYINELKKKFEEEFRNNPVYSAYFTGYNPDSVKNFISNYINRKGELIHYSEFYIERLEETKELRYREKTEAIFNLILQKKLFNKQLEWRARKIEIPQIRTSFDFEFWEDNIRYCPFIEEVSEREIDVLKQFLRSNNYNDQTESWLCGWQNYDEITEKNDTDDYDMMPEWYEFYDGMMGTGTLLLLPDLRDSAQTKYIHAAMHKQQEEHIRKVESGEIVYPPPPPPFLFANGKTLLDFARKFEQDEILIRLFKANCKQFEELTNESFEKEELEASINILLESDHPVYMPGGMEWKEAIHKCAQQYINTIIASELDSVYEEYLTMRMMGISGELKTDKFANHDYFANLFLEGKKLLGEPENFDF